MQDTSICQRRPLVHQPARAGRGGIRRGSAAAAGGKDHGQQRQAEWAGTHVGL